jgi:hypothetical protein
MKESVMISSSAIADHIGRALLHSVWKDAPLALLFGVAGVLLRRRSAQSRYVAGCITLALMVLAPRNASARWARSESVEWWSSISESVVVAKVTHARFGKRDGTWQPEHVTCVAVEILRGKATPPAIEIDVDLWISDGRDVHSDKPYVIGDRVLVFIARRTQSGKLEAAHWVNLAHPYSEGARRV